MGVDYINIPHIISLRLRDISHMSFIQYRITLLSLISFLMFYPTASAEAEQAKLELVSALPIDGPEDLNPSGLALCIGELVFVSDKHDDVLYRLSLLEKSAKADALIMIQEIPDIDFPSEVPWSFKLIKTLSGWIGIGNLLYDWEGVSCDQNGNYYLLSETFSDVLMISKTDKPQWMRLNLFKAAYQQGLMQGENFLEGMAWSNNNQFMSAVERNPRGLLMTNKLEDGLWKTKVHASLQSSIKPKSNRQEDFTGMAIYKENVFTLERNASSVCARALPDFIATQCWSYSHIENDPKYSYSDQRYGIAEGLVVSDEALYIIMDNNGDRRLSDTNDTRAQLLIFQTPELDEAF